jgi:hypothetical protein
MVLFKSTIAFRQPRNTPNFVGSDCDSIYYSQSFSVLPDPYYSFSDRFSVYTPAAWRPYPDLYQSAKYTKYHTGAA